MNSDKIRRLAFYFLIARAGLIILGLAIGMIIVGLSAMVAEAQLVRVYHVSGPYSINRTELDIAINFTKGAYERIGRPLRFAVRPVRNDPCAGYGGLSAQSRLSRLYCYTSWLKRRRGRANRREISHFVVPPINDGGTRYIGGYAYKTCAQPGVNAISYSNAQTFNQDGKPRLYHSSVAASHEIGHIRGAPHHDEKPATIMHSNVLGEMVAGATSGQVQFHLSSAVSMYCGGVRRRVPLHGVIK